MLEAGLAASPYRYELAMSIPFRAANYSWCDSPHLPRSVLFNFLGRDFFNALAEKNAEKFTEMLVKWLIALCCGIPVFVFRDYYQAPFVPRFIHNMARGAQLH